MTITPGAGWYTDPGDASALRYWDGSRWTDHTAPMPSPASATTDDRRAAARAAKESAKQAKAAQRADRAAAGAARKDERNALAAQRADERGAQVAARAEERAAAKLERAAQKTDSKRVRTEQRAAASADKRAAIEAKDRTIDAFSSGQSVAELAVPPAFQYLLELEAMLERAAVAAIELRIESEERTIRLALDQAMREGSFGGRKLVKRRVEAMTTLHRLRVGATHLVRVKPEGAFMQYGRKGALSNVQIGDRWLDIYSDRVVGPEMAKPIDAYTQAQVYLDGQQLVTQRPTLTRMALLSPLPGSALLPGLALQKKEKVDTRQGQFTVAGKDWNRTILVAPEAVPKLRGIAEQINRIAEAMADAVAHAAATSTPAPSPQAASTPAPGTDGDVLTRLERIASLQKSGAITDVEAAALKAQVLGNL